MAKSMTGYGRAQQSFDGMDITVELRSVNHRYLEITSKVPRDCIFLEEKLKSFIKERIARGKVDVFLTVNTNAGNTTVEVNTEFAGPYIEALRQLAAQYGVKDDISVSTVAKNPDVFTITKAALNEDELLQNVSAVEDAALKAFIEMRRVEGEKLKADILSRTDVILNEVQFIEERSPETVREYREKLELRMRELLDDANIEEQRLITETGLIADKLAVCEETVRLKSHVDQLKNLLETDDPIGRKLDFIVQEMNREANTIGSKAQDVSIQRAVVELKSEIEKIREQVQNLE